MAASVGSSPLARGLLSGAVQDCLDRLPTDSLSLDQGCPMLLRTQLSLLGLLPRARLAALAGLRDRGRERRVNAAGPLQPRVDGVGASAKLLSELGAGVALLDQVPQDRRVGALVAVASSSGWLPAAEDFGSDLRQGAVGDRVREADPLVGLADESSDLVAAAPVTLGSDLYEVLNLGAWVPYVRGGGAVQAGQLVLVVAECVSQWVLLWVW